MAFTKGVSQPKGGNTSGPKYFQTRLGEVLGYDLDASREVSDTVYNRVSRKQEVFSGQSKGVLRVKIGGEVFNVVMSAATVSGVVNGSVKGKPSAKFNGFAIDGKFEAHRPPGSEVVLENLLVARRPKDGEPGEAVCNWLHTSHPGKSIEGLLTLKGYVNAKDDKVVVHHVRVWNERAVDAESVDEVGRIAAVLNADAQERRDGKFVAVQRGFQLRAVAPDGVIKETSIPYDWSSDEKRAFDGNDLNDYLSNPEGNFVSYVRERYGADTRVEICTFEGYRPGEFFEEKTLGNTKSEQEIRKSMLSVSRIDPDDDKTLINGMAAMRAVVALPVLSEVTAADCFYPAGFMGNLHNQISGPNGEKRALEAALMVRKPGAPDPKSYETRAPVNQVASAFASVTASSVDVVPPPAEEAEPTAEAAPAGAGAAQERKVEVVDDGAAPAPAGAVEDVKAAVGAYRSKRRF